MRLSNCYGQLMRTLRITYLILVSVFFIGCNDGKNVRLLENLKQYPYIFRKVVMTCYNDTKLKARINQNTDFQDLNIETQKCIKLLELGEISYVVLSRPDCNLKDSLKLEIVTRNDECLEFTPCKGKIHYSGQHEYHKASSIDIYYLNENWVFWIDNDFI